MASPIEIAFTRRTTKALNEIVDELRALGLPVAFDDVAGNLAAVGSWLSLREAPYQTGLNELCRRTGWPMPTPDGLDHTGPAASAVWESKRALERAMLADSLSGVSANDIATRALNVMSRPTALKIVAGEKLLHEAVAALTPWFEREVPLHIHPGVAANRTSVELSATWEDEPEARRRELLDGVDEAVHSAGLAMRNPETKSPCDSQLLVSGDSTVVELHRSGASHR